MRFWAKRVQMVKGLCENGTQSMRDVAQQSGVSKRSVHRLPQAMERRDISAESWVWDTEEGRPWLRRLGGATIYPLGCKRGGGAETMSESVVRLPLQEPRGCAPHAWRSVLQTLGTLLVETAKTWESEATAHGEVRDLMGAGDATCLASLRLVFMDLHRGDILREEVAADRTSPPWKALGDDRLTTLQSRLLSLGSARAKPACSWRKKASGA